MARKKKKGLIGGNKETTEEVIVETVETPTEDSVVEEELVEVEEEVIEEAPVEEEVIEEAPVEEEVIEEAPVEEEVIEEAPKKVAEKRAKKTATLTTIKALTINTDRPIQAENGTATVTNVEVTTEAVTVVKFNDDYRLLIGNSAVVKTDGGEVRADQLEAKMVLNGNIIANVDVTESIQYVIVPTTTKGNFAASNGVVITSGGLMRKSLINLY